MTSVVEIINVGGGTYLQVPTADLPQVVARLYRELAITQKQLAAGFFDEDSQYERAAELWEFLRHALEGEEEA